jgi:carbamoyl-phosphate synthase small subunit
MKGLELASKVSTKNLMKLVNGNNKVALIDFGVKKNIIRCLNERNCMVKVFPFDASLEEITNF